MNSPIILNSEGKPIFLNALEKQKANIMQKHVNSLGYEIDVTTLTTIMKKVSEQKFFKIAPADFIPVRVGEGAWSAQLTTYRSFALGDDFEGGVIGTGANSSRLASADSGVDSVDVKVFNWAKQIDWTIFDLEQASRANNWDLVTAKEKARKTNWDLGIQKIAFLGIANNAACNGLFNQAGITPNETVITKLISTMSTAELKTFSRTILADYRSYCARTAWPTHFVIPEADYLGLASQSSADFPIKSVLQVLQEMFATMCMNPDFKILPNAYSDQLAQPIYALYNYEEESLRMDIPVDYTSTVANSLNSFNFSNVGYGQFTGVQTYRPLELRYYRIAL